MAKKKESNIDIEHISPKSDINYWTVSDVRNLQDVELWKNFDPNNYKKALRNLQSAARKLKTKQDNNDVLIDELKEVFLKEKLVFVLGAGVSMSFGLPTWDVLLQKLMVATLEKDKKASTVLSKLFSKIFNPSPLIAGRYLQKYYEENNLSFEEAVREVLYQEIDREYQSDLMSEIIRYCVAPGKSPNLNSIITYNFDDILEDCIEKISLDIPFKSVYGDGIDVDAGELPIYHVHGYLPEKSNLNSENQITFGESIYHKQYINTYSWNNIVQINKFRDDNCLFIGTSLTDPNTRRLLDIASQQRTDKSGYHYIFKLKYNPENVHSSLEVLLNQNKDLLNEKVKAELKLDSTAKTLTQTIESFEENDMKSLGIKTLWIDDYTDIPKILKKIRTK